MTNTQTAIRQQFEKLADAAGLNMTASHWGTDTFDFGSFTFETRTQAQGFAMLTPEGYASELLGPTNTVSVEIVY